jgi:hypothetical protein
MKQGQVWRWSKIPGESEPSEPAKAEPSKPKRILSKAGKANIVAALKKRWAAKKAGTLKASPAVVKKGAVKKTAAKKGTFKGGEEDGPGCGRNWRLVVRRTQHFDGECE